MRKLCQSSWCEVMELKLGWPWQKRKWDFSLLWKVKVTFPSTGSIKESDFSLLWKEKELLSSGYELLIGSVWLIWCSHRSQQSPLCVHPTSACGASAANMGVRGTSTSLSSRSSSSLKEIKEGCKIRDWEGPFSWGAEGRSPHWGWHLWGEKLRNEDVSGAGARCAREGTQQLQSPRGQKALSSFKKHKRLLAGVIEEMWDGVRGGQSGSQRPDCAGQKAETLEAPGIWRKETDWGVGEAGASEYFGIDTYTLGY